MKNNEENNNKNSKSKENDAILNGIFIAFGGGLIATGIAFLYRTKLRRYKTVGDLTTVNFSSLGTNTRSFGFLSGKNASSNIYNTNIINKGNIKGNKNIIGKQSNKTTGKNGDKYSTTNQNGNDDLMLGLNGENREENGFSGKLKRILLKNRHRPSTVLCGKIVSINDGDNVRVFHTPGGYLAGWGWIRSTMRVRDFGVFKVNNGGTKMVYLPGIYIKFLSKISLNSSIDGISLLRHIFIYLKSIYYYNTHKFDKSDKSNYVFFNLFNKNRNANKNNNNSRKPLKKIYENEIKKAILTHEKLNGNLANATINIRIAGVDAPELPHFGNKGQPGASDALKYLRKLALGRRCKVYLLAPDQYGRAVARVEIIPPLLFGNWYFFFINIWRKISFFYGVRGDLGSALLYDGHAVVYQSVTGAEFDGLERIYRRIEAKAKKAKRGIWKLRKFESPKEYKSRTRE